MSRLPPLAPRISAKAISLPLDGHDLAARLTLVEDVNVLARRPINTVAGQHAAADNPAALCRANGRTTLPLVGVDPPQPIAAGQQVAAADAEQMHRVLGQPGFPQHLAALSIKAKIASLSEGATSSVPW